jgi:phosphosulfolactate phosphohydrolase-like enzyme
LNQHKSPEARAAENTFLQFKDTLLETLKAIGSGRELIAKDCLEDVQLAAQLNDSLTAPRLQDGYYSAT